MSSFNSLFKKYISVSDLTKVLNNSVIILKRQFLYSDATISKMNSNLKVSESEVLTAYKNIAEILKPLETFLIKQDPSSEFYELMDNKKFKNQILNDIVYRDNISNTLKKIIFKVPLKKSDFSNIDKFISVLDNESAILFRKLRIDR